MTRSMRLGAAAIWLCIQLSGCGGGGGLAVGGRNGGPAAGSAGSVAVVVTGRSAPLRRSPRSPATPTFTVSITDPDGNEEVPAVTMVPTDASSDFTGTIDNVPVGPAFVKVLEMDADAGTLGMRRVAVDVVAGSTTAIRTVLIPPGVSNSNGRPTTQNAAATTAVTYGGNLDPTASTVRSQMTWYDADGGSHAVTLLLTRSGADWTFALQAPSGGAWTAGPSASGALTFDGNGMLTTPSSVRLELPVAGGALQEVDISFGDVFTQPGPSTLYGTADGAAAGLTPGTPTTSADFAQSLDGDEVVGAEFDVGADFVDPPGNVHNVQLAVTKTGQHMWSYELEGVAPWTVHSANTAGTLTFDDSGKLATLNGSPVAPLVITLGKGTPLQQQIQVRLLLTEAF